jgi:hypothetical protein
MNPLLKHLLSRYMKPMGDDGADAGGTGTVDRGDDFTPTEDDDEQSQDSSADTKSAADPGPDVDPENPDAEPDAEAEAEGKAEDDKKKREARIPLSRHKEMLEKERAKRSELEQKLAQYQQGKQVAELNEDITAAEENILKLEKDYATLLADGEVEKATALMAKIRGIERQMAEAKSDMKIAAAEARATERARYNIALERIESEYPQLNVDHEDYDEELMQDVVDLKVSYETRRGLTPTAAMQKAVEKLLGASTKAQKKVLDTTPRVTEKDVSKEKAAERKQEAVKTAVEAVKKTPPSTTRVGMDNDKAGGALTAADIKKMSQADFAKLTDEQLAQMRGDVL